jgi:hypothetical protein
MALPEGHQWGPGHSARSAKGGGVEVHSIWFC